ncbi:MAG: hypothetical protein J1F03_10025, partial [Oscillospiraceae bacterium]|nr:hypothetical protein [Oscillospiraceae bacterium]
MIRLNIFPEMDYDYFHGFNDNVHDAMSLLDKVNKMLRKLPPYNKILRYPIIGLDDFLNSHDYFFENGLSSSDRIDEDYVSEYGTGERDENGGRYFSYCDSPLSDEPDKTCRDVGARRRYGDKYKNDPVWQTYNRAYKAHYAR